MIQDVSTRIGVYQTGDVTDPDRFPNGLVWVRNGPKQTSRPDRRALPTEWAGMCQLRTLQDGGLAVVSVD
jgi:hypothetical protein